MTKDRGAPAERGRPDHYLDREVVETYDRRYRRGLARWKHLRKARILARWIPEGDRVLEVACGPGRFSGILRGRRYIGLDRSPQMLARFQSDHPGMRLVHGDAARLPFPDDSFDSVLSIRFLAQLRGDYRARVIAELARVSRGSVIIDGRHLYNLRFISRWLRRRLGLAHADKLRHRYRDFRTELAAAGLEVTELRSIAWGLSARFVVRALKR